MNYLQKITSLFFAIITLHSFAQTTSQKKQFIISKSATVIVSEIKEDWKPALQAIEAPKPGIDTNRNRIKIIKDSLQKIYPKKISQTSLKNLRAPLPVPYVGKNFQGNSFTGGTPNDNDIAISDSNKIVSVMNSSVFSYNKSTNTQLSFLSLDAFGSSLNNTNNKYDPKVIYDPNQDKYILLYLNGVTDTTSSITVAFSQTNDPSGSWNLYSIPGNPLNNGLWSDYPMIAITDKEAFITVNLLYPDSSWQTGFNETLIWQIDKESGYSGASLTTQLHSGISSNGKRVRNLCPVKGGSDIYGPDMYFLSNRNLDPQNDSIFLVRISDTISAPGQTLTVTPLVSNTSYFMPPPASQPGGGTQLIETNDSRILGAFLENNKIQFVGNCLDTATGFAAIYHGIINNITTSPVVTGKIIGDTLLELGYPNISYMGSGASDNRAAISFNHSALTVNPGVSAMVADDNGNYSPIIIVKPGVHFINLLPGNDRWGDYTGSQRKYNEPGVVWINGMFAVNSSALNKSIRTWIAELSLNPLIGINEQTESLSDLSLFPNPTMDVVNVKFSIEKSDYLSFEIYDINGRLIKLLLREKVKAGENNFSFSTSPLTKGAYILKVKNDKGEFLSKKIIVQ